MDDNSLFSYYMKGFKDELHGTTSTESDNELENKAYQLGALHAIVGDDVSSIDLIGNEEILKMIKE